MSTKIIIGITGTLGAGKGEIVNYLVTKRGFKHFSVRKFLCKEIKKRNIPINRKNMRLVANEIRAQKGSGYIAEKLYEKALKGKENSVIESIRTPGEVNTLLKKGKFYLFAVVADLKIRFERIKKRASETDNVTYKEFIEAEKMEMNNSDPTKQNLTKCIKMANYKFENSETFENLYEQVDRALENILTK